MQMLPVTETSRREIWDLSHVWSQFLPSQMIFSLLEVFAAVKCKILQEWNVSLMSQE